MAIYPQLEYSHSQFLRRLQQCILRTVRSNIQNYLFSVICSASEGIVAQQFDLNVNVNLYDDDDDDDDDNDNDNEVRKDKKR